MLCRTISFYIAAMICVTACSGKAAHDKKPGKQNPDLQDPGQAVGCGNEENIRLFHSLSKLELFTKLFGRPEFDSDSNAAWKPDYEDRLSLPLSDDGKCHTAVDTVMYFTDHRNTPCAVVIFANYLLWHERHSIPHDVGGSHFEGVRLGIALFSQSNEGWNLYEFKKHFAYLGYFGTYRTGRADAGMISLKTIGDRWTCLSLVQGIGGNTGVFSGYEQLFSIEEYPLGNQEDGFSEQPASDLGYVHTILSYNYSESGYGETLEEEDRIYTDRQMKIIPKRNDYYDIELLTTTNGRKTKQKYKYSEKYKRYI